MINAAPATGQDYVGRKIACTTCTRTRAMLQRDTDIDLNELSQGLGWTFFLHAEPNYSRIHRNGPPRRKTAYARVSHAQGTRQLALRVQPRAEEESSYKLAPGRVAANRAKHIHRGI